MANRELRRALEGVTGAAVKMAEASALAQRYEQDHREGIAAACSAIDEMTALLIQVHKLTVATSQAMGVLAEAIARQPRVDAGALLADYDALTEAAVAGEADVPVPFLDLRARLVRAAVEGKGQRRD